MSPAVTVTAHPRKKKSRDMVPAAPPLAMFVANFRDWGASLEVLKAALLDHLILVLDEQLDPLDGGGGGLGHASSHAGEHERLEEPKLLFSHNVVRVTVSLVEVNQAIKA